MDRMRRIARITTLFLFAVCVGVVGVSLAKTLLNQRIPHLYVSPKAITDYKTSISAEKKNIEQLDLLIGDAEKKLKDYQALSDRVQASDLEKKMTEELNYYKAAAGAVDMEGEGVVVTVDDGTATLKPGDDPNTQLIHDSDLLMLVNELNASGAEVISIKGQRMGNCSSVACAGYTVQINGQKFARPFEITAIGDSKRMAAALIGPGGYGSLLRDYGLRCDVQVKDKVVISAYPDDQTFTYMKKTEEEDKN